jgi:rubredoxin
LQTVKVEKETNKSTTKEDFLRIVNNLKKEPPEEFVVTFPPVEVKDEKLPEVEEHQKSETVQQQKAYQCPECQKFYKSRYNLAKHQKIHERDRLRFRCDLCSESYLEKQSLQKHLRLIHTEGLPSARRSWLCKVCNEKFGTEKKKFEHIREVHGENLLIERQKAKENTRVIIFPQKPKQSSPATNVLKHSPPSIKLDFTSECTSVRRSSNVRSA